MESAQDGQKAPCDCIWCIMVHSFVSNKYTANLQPYSTCLGCVLLVCTLLDVVLSNIPHNMFQWLEKLFGRCCEEDNSEQQSKATQTILWHNYSVQELMGLNWAQQEQHFQSVSAFNFLIHIYIYLYDPHCSIYRHIYAGTPKFVLTTGPPNSFTIWASII
jgi:hypothetical protein